MVMTRADKSEKLAEAKKLIADGASVMGAAKQIDIPQSTLNTWLTNEKKEKPEPEPKVSPQETEVAKEETSNGFTAKDKEPIPYVAVERDPLHYKNIHWMKRIDEYATNNELAKLKIDFANLTLLSTLTDTMKLKVIEYIVRM